MTVGPYGGGLKSSAAGRKGFSVITVLIVVMIGFAIPGFVFQMMSSSARAG